MITFKSFLVEKFIKSWETEKTNLQGAIDFLNQNCKNGIKAVANGGLLFRGVTNLGKDYYIQDSSRGIRTSKDSNNAYQLLMDNSSALSGYPSRSNSFICTAYRDYALTFGDIYVMIPVDGTKVAVADSDDFFGTYMNDGVFRDHSIEDLSELLGLLFSKLGVKPSKGKFTSMQDVNEAMSKFSPLEIAFIYTMGVDNEDMFILQQDAVPDEVEEALEYIDRHVGANYNAVDSKQLKAIRTVIEYAQKNNKKIQDDKAKALYDALKAAPQNARGNALASNVMTQKSLQLKLVTFGQSIPFKNECWFSGRCVAIAEPAFAGILYEMKKRGFKISHEYYDLMAEHGYYDLW